MVTDIKYKKGMSAKDKQRVFLMRQIILLQNEGVRASRIAKMLNIDYKLACRLIDLLTKDDADS